MLRGDAALTRMLSAVPQLRGTRTKLGLRQDALSPSGARTCTYAYPPPTPPSARGPSPPFAHSRLRSRILICPLTPML